MLSQAVESRKAGRETRTYWRCCKGEQMKGTRKRHTDPISISFDHLAVPAAPRLRRPSLPPLLLPCPLALPRVVRATHLANTKKAIKPITTLLLFTGPVSLSRFFPPLPKPNLPFSPPALPASASAVPKLASGIPEAVFRRGDPTGESKEL